MASHEAGISFEVTNISPRGFDVVLDQPLEKNEVTFSWTALTLGQSDHEVIAEYSSEAEQQKSTTIESQDQATPSPTESTEQQEPPNTTPSLSDIINADTSETVELDGTTTEPTEALDTQTNPEPALAEPDEVASEESTEEIPVAEIPLSGEHVSSLF